MTRKLAVVPKGAKSELKPEPPKTVKAAADHSERALLVALRSSIASEIDGGVAAAYLAPLARQLREIDREIRALDARTEQEASEDADEAEDEAFDPKAV